MKLGLSSPPRSGVSASALLVLGAIVAGLGGGCSTVSYRVPGLEVQRLANLPPYARGADVRVVPDTAPLYPSTQRPAPPPPPVVAPPPGPPAYGPEIVVEDEPPPVVVVEPGVYVDVAVPIGGHRPYAAPPPRGVGTRPPARVAPPPARAGFTGTPVSGGGLRGSPPATTPSGGGWRGSPVASTPRAPSPGRSSVPSRSGGGTHSTGGGHHGGGGSSADAAIGAAVLVVGLVAIASVAAENAAEADQARTFDGWVNVEPSHPLLLHYSNNYEIKVPLNELQPRDTIGLQYGVLLADDGPVQLKPPTPRVPAVPAPAVAPAPAPPVATRALSPPPAAAPSPATTDPAAARPTVPPAMPAPPATAPPPLQPAPPAAPAQPTS